MHYDDKIALVSHVSIGIYENDEGMTKCVPSRQVETRNAVKFIKFRLLVECTWVAGLHYCTLFPTGSSSLSQKEPVEPSRNPERGTTFGGVKHSVYENGMGGSEARAATLVLSGRDFVKIALPCSSRAIRSMSRGSYNIYKISFDVAAPRDHRWGEFSSRLWQPGNRSDIWPICEIYFANIAIHYW